MKKERGPYIMVTDDDSHHYVIPKAREEEWWKWAGSEEALDGDVPAWAEEVGGSPTLVVFPSYDIR